MMRSSLWCWVLVTAIGCNLSPGGTGGNGGTTGSGGTSGNGGTTGTGATSGGGGTTGAGAAGGGSSGTGGMTGTGGTASSGGTTGSGGEGGTSGGGEDCSNNVREGEEVCDGTDLGSVDACDDLGLGFDANGTLACDSSCEEYDVSACTYPDCPNESCDTNANECADLPDGVDIGITVEPSLTMSATTTGKGNDYDFSSSSDLAIQIQPDGSRLRVSTSNSSFNPILVAYSNCDTVIGSNFDGPSGVEAQLNIDPVDEGVCTCASPDCQQQTNTLVRDYFWMTRCSGASAGTSCCFGNPNCACTVPACSYAEETPCKADIRCKWNGSCNPKAYDCSVHDGDEDSCGFQPTNCTWNNVAGTCDQNGCGFWEDDASEEVCTCPGGYDCAPMIIVVEGSSSEGDFDLTFSAPPTRELVCNNGVDEDGDGSPDCTDQDCSISSTCGG